jgi:hypothetical protein
MSDDLAATLRALLDRLAVLGLRYMLVGSVAALAHGRSRATQDFDVVVDLDETSLRRLLAALPAGRFYVSLEAALDALVRRTLFNIIDLETGWKIDVVPLKRRPFSVRELDRRVPVSLFGATVYVATVEDTIVAKLEWSKMSGGSARQMEDITELLRIAGGRLDRDYVDAAVSELGLAEEWRAARRRSDDL